MRRNKQSKGISRIERKDIASIETNRAVYYLQPNQSFWETPKRYLIKDGSDLIMGIDKDKVPAGGVKLKKDVDAKS